MYALKISTLKYTEKLSKIKILKGSSWKLTESSCSATENTGWMEAELSVSLQEKYILGYRLRHFSAADISKWCTFRCLLYLFDDLAKAEYYTQVTFKVLLFLEKQYISHEYSRQRNKVFPCLKILCTSFHKDNLPLISMLFSRDFLWVSLQRWIMGNCRQCRRLQVPWGSVK